MKTKVLGVLLILMAVFLAGCSGTYAKSEKISLNDPVTDDVAHTFQYSNLSIDSETKPYSLTISVENGYFKTDNFELNNQISTYFDFKGGSDTSNTYIYYLNTYTNFKSVSFNLKDSVDLSDATTHQAALAAAQAFLRGTLFHNNEGQDATFSLSLSELKMEYEGNPVVAYKPSDSTKEHYYVKIMGVTDWRDAYKAAAGMTWNGLQGYLLTITTQAEHNYIYQSLGSIQGWMGGAAITNADTIATDNLWNTTNITWNGAADIWRPSTNKADYWYWVSGPEAGTKMFADGRYTQFNNGEPNNADYKEWCLEYGFGTGGNWNDYASDNTSIEGYYVEFGGFDNDNPEVAPVSYSGTFAWDDYDFEKVKQEVKIDLNAGTFSKNTPQTDLEDLVRQAIEDAGETAMTFEVKNRTVSGDKLSFDLVLNMGSETRTVHEEVTLKQFTVTFNANGHGTAPAAQTLVAGDKVANPGNLTADNYAFKGWYTDEVCTKAYDFSTTPTTDLTLYAKWEKAGGVTTASNPNTSDGPIVWFLLGGVAVTGIVGAAIYRKKFSK